MKHNIQLLFVIFLLAVGVVWAETSGQAAEKKPKERLAILDLDAKFGVEKGFAEALSVIVRDKIHSFGEYQVMSAEDIQAVASREQLKQVMGCDESAGQCLIDFGRKIDSRFMVAGDISKLGSTYTVSLRMLDTKGNAAGVTNRVSESCKCDDDMLISKVQDVAARLVGKPASVARTVEEERPRLAEQSSPPNVLPKIPTSSATSPRDTGANFSGSWFGQWTNSTGESGADSLIIQEDTNGNLQGTWSGTVTVKGKRTGNASFEMSGKTANREYLAKATLENGGLLIDYTAWRLNATGSYSGKSILRTRVGQQWDDRDAGKGVQNVPNFIGGMEHKPSLPIKLVDNWNTSACETTANAEFNLDQPILVNRIELWYRWHAREESVGYTLAKDGHQLHSGALHRGDCDPYQENWCVAIDEPDLRLNPGGYYLRTDRPHICQNRESYGNGFVKVYREAH